MIFLLLFSYVIICDFFPLYQFPVDVCSPSRTELEYKSESENEKQTTKDSSPNATQEIPYGFRQHSRPALTELILVVWVFTLLCEEVRQVN